MSKLTSWGGKNESSTFGQSPTLSLKEEGGMCCMEKDVLGFTGYY